MYQTTNDDLELLTARARADRVRVDPALDQALTHLDADLQAISAALGVRHVGPGVGLDGADEVYRLVVDYHVWDLSRQGWGLFVCDAAAGQDLRPMWQIQGAARVRKQAIVRQLPALLEGYQDTAATAGRLGGEAGERLTGLASALAG